jgi:acetyl esterase/lipase
MSSAIRPAITTEDVVLPTTPAVTVRVYRPKEADKPRATILWIHGGAFVGGSVDMPESDTPCRAFAEAGLVAVAVDYRLAPGLAGAAQRRPDAVRYPLPLDDCAAAWDWAIQLGSSERLLVGGASAGGALATTLVLRLRRHAARLPDGVVLAYPLLHAELPPLPPHVRRSLRGWRRLGTFSRRAVRWMGRNYVGPGGTARLAEAFPDPAELAGFPPTMIVDSEFDTLRASSGAFAAALGEHGVPVTHVVESGTRHGHLNRDSPAQRATLRQMAAWITERR